MDNVYQDDIFQIDDFEEDEEFREFMKKFDVKPLSPEEMRARFEKENAERIARGILPVPEGYESVGPIPVEYVKANPERYIVPECLPACKELWSKNIDTFMVCDLLNLEAGWAWICIEDTLLSDRNKEILASLEQIPDVTVYTDNYYDNTVYIMIPFVGQAAQGALLGIAKRFEMQAPKE